MLLARSHKLRDARRGQVVVLVAVSMVALLGAAALAVDGGLLIAKRRQSQATADAAALAGAIELFKGYQNNAGLDVGGVARSSALAIAAANGYSNDGVESEVTVNIAPTSQQNQWNEDSPFYNKPSYVEVNVKHNHLRYFSTIWGSSRIPVSARAVARGAWVPPAFGVLTLDPTANPATNASGGGTVTVDGGGMITNSDSSGGLRVTGGGSMVAESFDVAGSGYTGTNFSTTPTTGVPPTPDPLRYLPEPTRPAAGSITYIASTRTFTITAGTFGANGSINSTPPKLPNFTNGDIVNFGPGIYYLLGGLSSGGGVTITGTNVMFFNVGTGTNDKVSITGGTVTLTPPTTGIYRGITFFQSRSSTQFMQITGSGTTNIDGTFYVPNAELKVTGGSGTANIGSQYISKTLTLSGQGNVNINYATGEKSRQRHILLVE